MLAGICARARVFTVVIAALFAVLAAPAPTAAQGAAASFKVAYYNVKSGKGQVGLTGTATFADTANCTDSSQPVNAWGVGFVQSHLVASLANDPAVVALGLGESWSTVYGSPENIRQALGWKSRTTEQNGVAMVAPRVLGPGGMGPARHLPQYESG